MHNGGRGGTVVGEGIWGPPPGSVGGTGGGPNAARDTQAPLEGVSGDILEERCTVRNRDGMLQGLGIGLWVKNNINTGLQTLKENKVLSSMHFEKQKTNLLFYALDYTDSTDAIEVMILLCLLRINLFNTECSCNLPKKKKIDRIWKIKNIYHKHSRSNTKSTLYCVLW